jgi:hypothetical protein
MSLQIGPLIKTPLTYRAFMRGFFHMKDSMHCQCSGLAKSFAAFRTLERLFLRMNVSVIP